jgi:hypothetical protein
VTDAGTATSLPGPLGLPGGYPVRLTAGRGIALDLPAGLDRDAAIAWNERAGRRDGVEIRDGRVSFPARAAAALARYAPDLAAGWPVAALDEVTARLTALRQRLRHQGEGGSATLTLPRLATGTTGPTPR